MSGRVLIYTDGATRKLKGKPIRTFGGWATVILWLPDSEAKRLPPRPPRTRDSYGEFIEWLNAEYALCSHTKILQGSERGTTNNRMELTAILEGLKAVKEGHPVVVYTDSEYSQKGLEAWVDEWVQDEWTTALGEPVKNKDLWEQLLCQRERLAPILVHIRGHRGIEGNERADSLAGTQAQFLKNLEDI